MMRQQGEEVFRGKLLRNNDTRHENNEMFYFQDRGIKTAANAADRK